MKLSVPERLHLMGLLPKEGDFLTLKTVRQAREMLAFDKDGEELGLCQEGERITWNAAADTGTEIDLPARAVSMIVERLTALDKEKKLSEDQYSLYEKFVGE